MEYTFRDENQDSLGSARAPHAARCLATVADASVMTSDEWSDADFETCSSAAESEVEATVGTCDVSDGCSVRVCCSDSFDEDRSDTTNVSEHESEGIVLKCSCNY